MSYAEAVSASLRRPHPDLLHSGHGESTSQYVSFHEQASEYPPLQTHDASRHASLDSQNMPHLSGTEATWDSVHSGSPLAQVAITSGSPLVHVPSGSPPSAVSVPFPPPGLSMPQGVPHSQRGMTTPGLSYPVLSCHEPGSISAHQSPSLQGIVGTTPSYFTYMPMDMAQQPQDGITPASSNVTSPPSGPPAHIAINGSPPTSHSVSCTLDTMQVAAVPPSASPQCSTSTFKVVAGCAISTLSSTSDNPFATQSPPHTPKKKRRRSKKSKAARNGKF
jgi:hypothetical protein